MKTLIAIYTLSFLIAVQQALAGAPVSSMDEHYDKDKKMCRQQPEKTPKTEKNYAAAAADPAAWILSLAPKKEKAMLASCCATKRGTTQAKAE